MSKHDPSNSNGSDNHRPTSDAEKQVMADKPAARRSRDSSLYRDVPTKPAADDDASPRSLGSRNVRFVINDDPELVPVNHQAVIDGLTNTLAEIETKHEQLETLLKSKNSANKLHIAQLKGQIAALKRRKTEIESVLSANDNPLSAASPGSPAGKTSESSPKSPKG